MRTCKYKRRQQHRSQFHTETKSALRRGRGAYKGVLLERLEREPPELRREPASLLGGALANGPLYRGASGLGVRGAVVDVHCEDEEDDVGDDEEGHQEREPPPERPELCWRGRWWAAPVVVARPVAAVVPRAMAAVARALGPALAAVHANGDHRRLAPPRHGAGGGKRWAARGMRARGAEFGGSGRSFASWRDGGEGRRTTSWRDLGNRETFKHDMFRYCLFSLL
jgi:hypothetical protein